MHASDGPRDHGLRIGTLPVGERNSVEDVPGVGVGHVTVIRDEPDPPAGRGVARTGVTAIAPGDPTTLAAMPMPAGMAVLNGAGEVTGSLTIAEWGVIETPVYLTSTMAVGRVYDGAVAAAVAADPDTGVERVVIPTVGECDDHDLNDARTVQVEADDAGRALAAALSSDRAAQGTVGAGTGMMTFDFAGGIGTSSRVAEIAGETFALGVVLLANFGVRADMRIDGVPVGRLLGPPTADPTEPAGSCVALVATDAPLTAGQLSRVARRAGLGLARTGSVAHHGSGEIFVAFSTGARTARRAPAAPGISDREIDILFEATVDATEEAVLNALWHSERMTGRMGRVAEPLPHDDVLEVLAAHRRLAH